MLYVTLVHVYMYSPLYLDVSKRLN